MAQEPPFEEFEHPADIGLRVRGQSLQELFENAARGMIELMLDPARVGQRRTLDIEVEGDDPESMLVAWLGEILYAFDADRFSPARVEVRSVEGGRARGRIWGEEFVDWRHDVRNVIKAVTWHNLKVEKRGGSYEVSIIFDV